MGSVGVFVDFGTNESDFVKIANKKSYSSTSENNRKDRYYKVGDTWYRQFG